MQLMLLMDVKDWLIVATVLGLHRISALAPANPKSGHFSQIRPNF